MLPNSLSIIVKVNFYTFLLFWAILYFHHYFLSSWKQMRVIHWQWFHPSWFCCLWQLYLSQIITNMETHIYVFAKCCSVSHSFIPMACTECENSLPFSGASSIPLCNVLFPVTLLHQPFFHPLSPHLAIYFLVYLSILLFPNSYIILYWKFYFLPFSVHAQTNIIYLTLLSLL